MDVSIVSRYHEVVSRGESIKVEGDSTLAVLKNQIGIYDAPNDQAILLSFDDSEALQASQFSYLLSSRSFLKAGRYQISGKKAREAALRIGSFTMRPPVGKKNQPVLLELEIAVPDQPPVEIKLLQCLSCASEFSPGPRMEQLVLLPGHEGYEAASDYLGGRGLKTFYGGMYMRHREYTRSILQVNFTDRGTQNLLTILSDDARPFTDGRTLHPGGQICIDHHLCIDNPFGSTDSERFTILTRRFAHPDRVAMAFTRHVSVAARRELAQLLVN